MINKPKQGAEVDSEKKEQGVCWVEGWDYSNSDVKTQWKLCVTDVGEGELGGYIDGESKRRSLVSERWTARHFMFRLNTEQIDAIIEGLQILKGEE